MTAAGPEFTAGDQSVVYVYGVTRSRGSQESAPIRLEGIVPEASVHRLVDANLMAFVSAVPAVQFGASEFRSALTDAAWLRDRIVAHEKIVAALSSSYDVVPFRFGTIFPDASQMSLALARHRAELCQTLDRIRNACEWGVKLYCDPDRLRCRVEAESDSIMPLRRALACASPGAGFFLQKKYAKALEVEVAARVASSIERSRECLDGCACETAEVQLQCAAVHGRSAEMVMNIACLVTKESSGRFQRIIAALQEEFAAHGFAYELTGPWPPYHFVSL